MSGASSIGTVRYLCITLFGPFGRHLRVGHACCFRLIGRSVGSAESLKTVQAVPEDSLRRVCGRSSVAVSDCGSFAKAREECWWDGPGSWQRDQSSFTCPPWHTSATIGIGSAMLGVELPKVEQNTIDGTVRKRTKGRSNGRRFRIMSAGWNTIESDAG